MTCCCCISFLISLENDEDATDPPVPTYDPTKKGTDPPVPTYDPTKQGTPSPTTAAITNDDETAAALYIPSPNPYIDKFNNTEWQSFNANQWDQRYENSLQIKEKYGTYCPNEPLVPMCPALTADKEVVDVGWSTLLNEGPKLECQQTGDKATRCGADTPWLNKTIWPKIRGPFCVGMNNKRVGDQPFAMPKELLPYQELGYDRVDPTKSTDAPPFDGGGAKGNLWFDGDKVIDHFLKFEAMLDHYYEGLSRPLLESAMNPKPDNPLYSSMIQQYADQIARALLRSKDNSDPDSHEIVIGVLGDSVTSGTDNCYYDAWPEQFRRQMAPLFGSMGLNVSIRNGGKNGGWLLSTQMLCANDMLGGSDRSKDGLDFILQLNLFVKAHVIDAEHFIRRALFGRSHTLIAMNAQDGMNEETFVERYASAGLIMTREPKYELPELHFPIPGHSYWFPEPGRAFWGMQSDGFCRISTRSGSAPVVKRNWHWGPLVHQTYADSYGLLFSRATRQAIADLQAGRMPPEPPSIDDYDTVVSAETAGWKRFLLSDMESNVHTKEGIRGVHCAIGSANQPGSTLMFHWLRPAEGSPFEEIMKSRGGVTFVPENHVVETEENKFIPWNQFYSVTSVISPPNNAVGVGDWVPNPNKFSAEAPRTADQCMHVDGSTMINFGLVKSQLDKQPEEFAWVVWKVPQQSLSIGRIMICHPRGAKMKITEDAFDTKGIRFHIAVPDANGGAKVVEDTQNNENKKENDECTVMVDKLDDSDRAAAWSNGLWVAVEFKKQNIFEFDYLVAM